MRVYMCVRVTNRRTTHQAAGILSGSRRGLLRELKKALLRAVILSMERHRDVRRQGQPDVDGRSAHGCDLLPVNGLEHHHLLYPV